MNFRTTVFLLFLLLVVGIFLFVDRMRTPPAQPPGDSTPGAIIQGRKLFTDVEPKDVDALTIVSSDGKWVLERKKGNWRFLQPIAVRADTWGVDGLVGDLLDLRSRAQLDPGGASMGLAQPRYRIEMKTASKTLSLAVGDKTALGDAMYVQVAGSDKADVVQSDAGERLEKPLDDLRDKQMLDVSATDVQRIEIDHPPSAPVTLAHREMAWYLVGKKDVPADDSAVQGLLSAITSLQATDFVKAANADVARTQLDHPQLTVRVSTTMPSTQPSAATAPADEFTSIAFGQYDDIRMQKLYATVVGSGQVVKVSNYVLESLNKSALDLRDKKVLDIDPAQVSKFSLRLTASPAPLVVERRKQSAVYGPVPNPLVPATAPAATAPAPSSPWAITSGLHGFANQARVDAFLAALHPLRADRYLEKSPVTQPAGITEYLLKITTQGPGGTPVTDYLIRLTDRGNDQPLIGSYDDVVFEVGRGILNSLEGDFTTPPKAPAPEAPPGGP